jgi:hypothetical protein
VRLLIDWAALQPDPGRPPDLEAAVSGCARTVSPCAPYAGVRDELAAIASQQRAAGTGAEGFQVVIELFGTPAWAARGPFGCEDSNATPFSRPPSTAAIPAYRLLIRSLLQLAKREGVALDWWSPWNEPDDSAFINPQRASCATGAAAVSPTLYAAIARAMAAELSADGGEHHLLLGELNAFPTESTDRTSVARFVAALPEDVVCLSEVWSIHVYATPNSVPDAAEPVKLLERALDARGPCGHGARIWVTEAGVGAPHPGSPRPAGAVAERTGCTALAGQLLRWYRDPRVGAVFQYTFREDPAYPVGLISADLSHVYATYRLWLAFAHRHTEEGLAPALGAACA